MDFSYTDEQTSILELAAQILGDGTSQERLREVEAGPGPRFDRELWRKLAEAGLLAVAVPEAWEGAGLGFLEVAGSSSASGGARRRSRISRRSCWARCRSPSSEARRKNRSGCRAWRAARRS
jgi:alkylation response protein AidB-like acyl-CoA dehydrogenase